MVVGEFTQEADLVVIGGGPAGYSAAFRAAELGMHPVVIDARGGLGGVCLHEGCVPSKTLLHIAEEMRAASDTTAWGATYAPGVDRTAIHAAVARTVSGLDKGLASTAKRHGVEVLDGTAHFEDGRYVGIRDGRVPRVRFRRALIATGSRPAAHPQLPFDGARIVAPETAVGLAEIPPRLLVVGSDYIAVEMATIFAGLGSAVTLAAAAPQLVPEADPDLVRHLHRRMKKMLAGLHLETSVAAAEVADDGIRVRLAGGGADEASFDRVIVCGPRVANVDALDLRRTKVVRDDHGFIDVDAQGRTSDPRIFAAGDVTGGGLLADLALHEGRTVAEVIAGHDAVCEPQAVPHVVYTDPQLAWCGITEQQCKEQSIEHAVHTVQWAASGRAAGMQRTDGVTKIIYDPSSQLVLGVGLCGVQATEMIGAAALAIEMGAVLTDLAETVFPHPTMCELLGDAARQALVKDAAGPRAG